MYEVFRAYLERNITVAEKEFDLIKELLHPKQIPKGAFLVREGEIAKEGAYVTKGCLRSYVIDNKGKEHIIQFAPKDWWITDF